MRRAKALTLSTTPFTGLVISIGYGGYDLAIVRSSRGQQRELAAMSDEIPSGATIAQQVASMLLGTFQRQGLRISPNHFGGGWLGLYDVVKSYSTQLLQEDVSEMTFQFGDGQPRGLRITRQVYDKMVNAELEPIYSAVQAMLDEANLTPDQIDHVLLVGEVTRIPCVRAWVADQFGDKIHELNDSALARGAAIHAQRLADEDARTNGQRPVAQPMPAAAPGVDREPEPEPEYAEIGISIAPVVEQKPETSVDSTPNPAPRLIFDEADEDEKVFHLKARGQSPAQRAIDHMFDQITRTKDATVRAQLLDDIIRRASSLRDEA